MVEHPSSNLTTGFDSRRRSAQRYASAAEGRHTCLVLGRQARKASHASFMRST